MLTNPAWTTNYSTIEFVELSGTQGVELLNWVVARGTIATYSEMVDEVPGMVFEATPLLHQDQAAAPGASRPATKAPAGLAATLNTARQGYRRRFQRSGL